MADVDKIGPALAAERAERLNGWRADIETIKHAVWEIHHHRFVWREMRAALVEKSPEETIFLDHYDRLYAQSQLIAVRRLVDSHRDSVSLTRLLSVDGGDEKGRPTSEVDRTLAADIRRELRRVMERNNALASAGGGTPLAIEEGQVIDAEVLAATSKADWGSRSPAP